MEQNIRRQLTLFVDQKAAKEIENIRMRFNPAQYELIKSHVTLCRADEIEDLSAVLKNLQQRRYPGISLWLDQAERSNNGKGVLIPVWSDNDQFQKLRSAIFQGVHMEERRPSPHITLMHPRNSVCTDDIFKIIQGTTFPPKLTFTTISFIEQIDGGSWKTIKKFALK